MGRFCALVVLLGLSACNTVASLHYQHLGPVQTSSHAYISGVTSTDQRKEAPTRIATVMGGFGNPLKTLDTGKPVKDEVADAFREGLRVRGLLAEGASTPFRLSLVIRKFDADMIIGRTARIDLTMYVNDRAGRIIYQGSATDSESDMKFLETGVLANIDDLRVLLQTVLDRTVDRMLDNAEFRDALIRASANTD
jgi:hypothetical protein